MRDRTHALLCGAVVALLVATPLIPSESAARLGSHVVVVMAWFAVAVLILVRGLVVPRPCRPLVPADVAVLLFLAVHSASALVTLGEGNARATLNSMWMWMAYGVLFLSVRHIFVTPLHQRALTSVLLALAAGLSAWGLYQVGYSNPRVRAEYAQNPERVLRSEGLDPTPGSPSRQQFENRLASVEPIGTFALTNSLAGLLVPSLVLWGFVSVSFRGSSRRSRLHTAGFLLLTGLVATCLVLTKSRAAYGAVILGTAFAVPWRAVAGRWFRWPFLLVVALVASGLLASIAHFGGLDRQVITEAPKSLLYRVEYWRATTAMIRDHPWCGCGPGNFQVWYTRYKAAGASETVADPHNFLLEIAATAGLPALVVFVAVLVVLAWGTRSASEDGTPAEDERTGDGPSPGADGSPRSVTGIYIGAAAGLAFSFPAGWAGGLGPDPALWWVVGPVMVASFGVLHAWVQRGRLPARPLVAAGAALLVNWLAAGGIGYPGVGQQFWWLAALAWNAANPVAIPTASVDSAARGGGRSALPLVGVLALAVACFFTMYRPVLTARRLVDQARAGILAAEAEQKLVAACAADPWSGAAWELLADLTARRWMAVPADATLDAFFRCRDELLARDRNSSRVYRLCGDWLLEMYAVAPRSQLCDEAVRAYERAVELYPNSGILHAQLAWACHVAGKAEMAAHHAQEAMRLDALMPHAELRLARERLVGGALAESPRGDGRSEPEWNAEQLLQRIRNIRNP